jgi:hypothetical protein
MFSWDRIAEDLLNKYEHLFEQVAPTRLIALSLEG